MRKIVFALVALVVATPALGDALTVAATQVGDTNEVEIGYNAPGILPRGFGLDITVDAGAITDISNFMIGECTSSSKGFGIFPANFARFIDPADPNTWGDANYTPVADPCDLPGDTLGGLGTGGITIEMGSLYVAPNSPPASGTLCSVWVSEDCNVGLAANVGRGKVVLEDGNEPSPLTLTGCKVTLVAACDGDLTGDGWVNSMDVSDIVNYIDTYGVWGAVARGSGDWDEKYNFETAGTQNDYINSQDVSKLVSYIDTEGVWGSIACPGPGMP